MTKPTIPAPPSITYLLRTRYRPTGHVFITLHRSSDIHFGTPYASDHFIGKGSKLNELLRFLTNTHKLTKLQIRQLFVTEVILSGTR